MMRVGLVKPWLLRYTFWWRVADCLFDFGVTSKETLLSFDTLANYPERALDLPGHGAARAYPWLLMVLVAGSVRRWGRWGRVEPAT